MLICVDGTGAGSGAERIGDLPFQQKSFTQNREANYATAMMGSFVGRIYYGSHLRNRKYYQGPDWSGTGPNMIWPYNLIQQITEFWRHEDHQIFMTGWSRGAAILIRTAALLKDKAYTMPDGQNAKVQAMFLFDAVDRSVELPGGTQIIPSNVEYCYHAMRDDSAHSRWSFGHCGISMEGANTFLVPRKFYTTHGGMGGVLWGEKGLSQAEQERIREDQERVRAGLPPGPIPPGSRYIDEGDPGGPTKVTVAQEKPGSDAVHDWMWPFLRKHGIL